MAGFQAEIRTPFPSLCFLISHEGYQYQLGKHGRNNGVKSGYTAARTGHKDSFSQGRRVWLGLQCFRKLSCGDRTAVKRRGVFFDCKGREKEKEREEEGGNGSFTCHF